MPCADVVIGDAERRRAPRTRRLAVLAAVGLATLTSTLAFATEDVSAVLLRKTQQFSDAGQQGQASVMAKMLDDRVVFFNEGGDQASKKDMVAGATAPAAGVKITMTVMDWNCQVHGNVAVASFIDDQVIDSNGELLHARYRSVETWLKSRGEWRMIGSETIALNDDPSTVALPPSDLDQYVGAYKTAAGARLEFTRKDDGLFASLNGGPATLQKAEVRDVFFTPGRARFRKVFQRDATGQVVALAYRREGHDTVFKRI